MVDRSLHSIGVVGSNPDRVETFRLDESLDSVYEVADSGLKDQNVKNKKE